MKTRSISEKTQFINKFWLLELTENDVLELEKTYPYLDQLYSIQHNLFHEGLLKRQIDKYKIDNNIKTLA